MDSYALRDIRTHNIYRVSHTSTDRWGVTGLQIDRERLGAQHHKCAAKRGVGGVADRGIAFLACTEVMNMRSVRVVIDAHMVGQRETGKEA